jgi:hypothetical protein
VTGVQAAGSAVPVLLWVLTILVALVLTLVGAVFRLLLQRLDAIDKKFGEHSESERERYEELSGRVTRIEPRPWTQQQQRRR